MNAVSIKRVAGLLGDAGRVRMLLALLDGKTHSASDLAIVADVSPQTASSHLSKLINGNFVVAERNGRQRLFRISNESIAGAVEAIGTLVDHGSAPLMPDIRLARICYDHLAGAIAIALRNELQASRAITAGRKEFELTPYGEKLLRRFRVDAVELRGLRRSFARNCLDWTEREHHIGGALGAALLTQFLDMKWLVRKDTTRALRLTHAGERGFEQAFGIKCAALNAKSRVTTLK